MKARSVGILLAAVALILISRPALAHHGVSEFDMKSFTTVKGVVTEFDMINPHTLIHFDAKNDKGVVEHWVAETQGPNMLIRAGWTRTILKPGDPITVIGNQAKDGRPYMRMEKVVLANGQELQQYPY